MIGPDRLGRVTAEAVVPEQVVHYVCAVSGSRPRLIGSCVAYGNEGHWVVLGYPLQDPLDTKAMSDAVDEALKIPDLERITVIGPARPLQAPSGVPVVEDGYYALPLPLSPLSQKLRNLLRHAERELKVERGQRLEGQHMALVREYMDGRPLAEGTRQIFRRLPEYLNTSGSSMMVSARLPDGKLAAFAVGEFGSLQTAFFMFCFRHRTIAPPGSADLVLSALLEEAGRRGHSRMNLGLGVNEGIRFFKRKWGAELYLPCVEVSWKPKSRGLLSHLRKVVWK